MTDVSITEKSGGTAKIAQDLSAAWVDVNIETGDDSGKEKMLLIRGYDKEGTNVANMYVNEEDAQGLYGLLHMRFGATENKDR